MRVDYDLLRSFVVVGQSSNFASAARQLHCTPSAVSQKMRTLESQVGVALFERVGRESRLTSEGRRLHDAVSAEYSRIDRSLHDLSVAQNRIQGVVRIGVPGPFSKLWLRSRIRQIAEKYPDIELDLTLGEAFDIERMLIESSIDVTFHFGFHYSSKIERQKIADEEVVAVVAPSYLERWGEPTSIEDLRNRHRYVVNPVRVFEPWWHNIFGQESAPPRRIFCRTSDMEEMIYFTRFGLGISVLPTYLIQDLLASGELRRLPLHQISPKLSAGYHKPIFLAWRKSAEYVPHICAVRDALLETPKPFA